MEPAILYTSLSVNKKTGPMPVTTTSEDSCPDACPLKDNGACYAKTGPVSFLWTALSKSEPGKVFQSGVAKLYASDWQGLTTSINALPAGQIWRPDPPALPGLHDKAA